MAEKHFDFVSFLIRFLVALVLVFASYNPSEYSWYHWFLQAENKLDALLLLAGVVLIIGWAIYLRATIRSLGAIGTLLAIAFFGALVWVLIDYDLLSLSNTTILQYVALLIMSAILATGISWSHIRRRITGQADVDEVTGDL